jgi:hypothetical protein
VKENPMHFADGVRAAVEAVDREVGLLTKRATTGDAADLRATWGKLVDALDLGPAPELRDCPHCGSSGMRAATRCGTCWAKLVPPASAASAS